MNSLPDEVNSQLESFQVGSLLILAVFGCVLQNPCHSRALLPSFPQTSLTGVEAALGPFLSKTPAQLDSQFDATARAQIYGGLASAAHSLFSMFLAARGSDPAASEFLKKEGHRLRQYDRKIRKVAAAEELNRSGRSLEVDVAAMSRFIAAAAPLSGDQKEELRRVGAEAAEKKKKKRSAEEADGGKHSGKKRKSGKKGDASADDAALAFLKDALGEVKK